MKRAVTSASNIARRKACPGSARMEAPFAETDSEYSAEGTMLHRLFLTGERPDTLTSEQSQTLDLGDYYAESFLATVREQFGISDDEPFVDEREVEMEFVALEGYDIFPGHADLIRTWPKKSVRAIIDAKYGVMEADQAAENEQLACYAVMSYQARPVDMIAVGISQPRNYGPRHSSAVYDRRSIEAAQYEIQSIVLASEAPDAPLNASEKACHFCKAKTVCSAYTAKFKAIQTIETTAIQTLDTTDLMTVFEVIKRAKKIDKEVSAEVRARIERGEFPGYKLGNSGEDVTLNDALGFFTELQSAMPEGVELTASEFDSTRALVLGKLETLLQTKLKISADRAKKLIRETIAPYSTRTPKQQKIVRDKNARLTDDGTTGFITQDAPEP